MELKEGVYAIDDQPNPLNEYGRTKLLGEQAVQEILDDYYIIRTSWVFGQYGHNFVYHAKLAETRDQLKVVDDQFGRPTDKNVSRIYGICYCRKSAIWCLSFV